MMSEESSCPCLEVWARCHDGAASQVPLIQCPTARGHLAAAQGSWNSLLCQTPGSRLSARQHTEFVCKQPSQVISVQTQTQACVDFPLGGVQAKLWLQQHVCKLLTCSNMTKTCIEACWSPTVLIARLEV